MQILQRPSRHVSELAPLQRSVPSRGPILVHMYACTSCKFPGGFFGAHVRKLVDSISQRRGLLAGLIW